MKISIFKKVLSLILSLALLLSCMAGMTLISATTTKTENLITNGDFETAFPTGMMYTDVTNITRVNAPQNDDAVTLDGYAAYVKGASASTKDILQMELNLSAGSYSLDFNTKIVPNSKSAYQCMFGVTTGMNTNSTHGTAYGGAFADDAYAKAVVSGTNEEYEVNKATTPYFYLGNNVSTDAYDLNVTITFDIATKTTVYFYVRYGASVNAYVDNINLSKVSTISEIAGGDFESGMPSSMMYTDETTITRVNAPQNGDAVTLDGYVAYLPGAASSTANDLILELPLAAGTYSLNFDAKLISLKTGWQLPFGIVTNLRSDNGTAYGSGATRLDGQTISVIDNTTNESADYFDKNSVYYLEYAAETTNDLTVTIDFSIDYEQTVYFYIRCSSNARAYIDNITLAEVVDPELDTAVLTMEREDMSKITVSNANQADGNAMKVEIIENYDSTHGNVLKVPTYTGASASDRPASGRFTRKYTSLEVGETYRITFEMQIPSFTLGTASQWLGLGGVSMIEPNIDRSGTFDAVAKLPNRIVTSTNKGASTPISFAPNTNWTLGVFQWNGTGSENWITYYIDFVAEETTAYFFIENYLSGRGDFYVDNLVIEKKSEALDGEIKFSVEEGDSVTPSENSKNVLVIGNSFAYNTVREQMLDVINAGEEELNVARYGKGAMAPIYFANQINNDRINMEFTYAGKDNTKLYTCTSGVSKDAVKNFAEWDYIIVQATTTSEKSTANWNDFTTLINAVNENFVTEGKTKVLAYIPWSVSQSYADKNYSGITAKTLKDNMDALADELQVLIDNGNLMADGVFSMNDAIWNARIVLGAEGVHADGLHLNSYGSYIVGLSIHKLVYGTDIENYNITIDSNADTNLALKQIANGTYEGVASYAVTLYSVNVNGDVIEGTQAVIKEAAENSTFEITPEAILGYNMMGYKVGSTGEIVLGSTISSTITDITDIYVVYAMRGDLNNDLDINATDLTLMRKYLLGSLKETDVYNNAAAYVNEDDVSDARDLVRLKKNCVN